MTSGKCILAQPELPHLVMEHVRIHTQLNDFWCVEIQLVCAVLPDEIAPLMHRCWQLQWQAQHTHYFYGVVSEWSVLDCVPAGQRYQVTIRPRSWALTQRQHYRALGVATWPEVLRVVMPLPADQWRISVRDAARLRLPTVPLLQAGQNDAAWLREQLSNSCLGWAFDHRHPQSAWMISDALHQVFPLHPLQGVSDCVVEQYFMPSAGMVTGPGVSAVQSAPYCLRYDALSDQQAQQWQQQWQHAQQVQAKRWRVTTNYLLWAGQRVQGFAEQQVGLVVASDVEIECGVAVSKVHLVDATQPYQEMYAPQPVQGVLPGCHVLTHQATAANDQPVVDQQGDYCIDLPDYWQKVGQSAYRGVPMVHAAHFDAHQLNLPHVVGAQVVLAFAQDALSFPMLLGAVNSSRSPRLTQHDTAHNWYWQDAHGSQLAFINQAGRHAIQCQVPNYDGQQRSASWQLAQGITRYTEGTHHAQHQRRYHMIIGDKTQALYDFSVQPGQWQEHLKANQQQHRVVAPEAEKHLTLRGDILSEKCHAQQIKRVYHQSHKQVILAKKAQYHYQGQHSVQQFDGPVRQRYQTKKVAFLGRGQSWQTIYQQNKIQIDEIAQYHLSHQRVLLNAQQVRITSTQTHVKTEQDVRQYQFSQMDAQQITQEFAHMQLGGCLVVQGRCDF